jgi:predicted ArsR family transcriptional regulator
MRTNRSVERAIALMMFICRDGKPIGLTQISQGVGLDKATTLRILNTLANSDLVRQELDTKRYVPGAGRNPQDLPPTSSSSHGKYARNNLSYRTAWETTGMH